MGYRYLRLVTSSTYTTYGGYLDVRFSDDNGSTQYPSNMTSNSLPSPYVASANTEYSSTFAAWKAFDNDPNSYWSTTNGTATNNYIQLDVGSGNSVNPNWLGYLIINYSGFDRSPHGVTLYGSNTGAFSGEEDLIFTKSGLSSHSNLTFVSFSFPHAAGSSAGSSVVSGVGSSTAQTTGTVSGLSTASGVGTAITRGVGASSGVSAVSGVGGATSQAVGGSVGTATAEAVGTSIALSDGSSSGAASVSGIGESTAASSGLSDGLSVVSGIGQSAAESVGSSSGVGSANAVGQSTAKSVGTSAGSSVVSGASDSSAIIEAVGSSDGIATVSAIGESTSQTVGSSDGTSTASGVSSSASVSAAVGSSSGLATVSGVGSSTAESVGTAAGAASVIGFITNAAIPEVVIDTHDGGSSKARRKRDEAQAEFERKQRAWEDDLRKIIDRAFDGDPILPSDPEASEHVEQIKEQIVREAVVSFDLRGLENELVALKAHVNTIIQARLDEIQRDEDEVIALLLLAA